MWPKLSNINSDVRDKILSYKTPDKASALNPWIRVFSGAVKGQLQGLILQSNTDIKLLRATGETSSTIYGDSQSSGIIGKDWTGKPIESNSSRFLRPSPIVTGFNVKEGQDQISREATLQLTAYTLEQMEEIQTYFLEPGYSLFIEWGWNTTGGARGVIETVGSNVKKILDTISKKSLNWQDLVETRIKSIGEYDGFLGFIVGGSVTSTGDTFNIEVRLRGEPSLPTYLQSYRNSKQLNPETKNISSSDKVNSLFSIEELTDEEGSVAKRRFQYMFNELPSDKQLNSIKKLPESATITQDMFINFDKHIEKNIVKSASGVYKGPSDLKDSGIEIQKQDLFSKNKYVRMDLVVQILNSLGSLDKFIVGDRQVSFQINIDNTIIGGFPNIFSTNPNKLIIPGQIPDFKKYFLTGNTIKQEKTGDLKTDNQVFSPINPDDTLKPFLGTTTLSSDYKETAGYYGYLKYLFINFDIVKSALNKKIVNSREVFIYLLNEISSAVNAFWKFQVVEGEFTPTLTPFVGPRLESEQSGIPFYLQGPGSKSKTGDVQITVIDENFIGQLPDDILKNVTVFEHNGIGSVFLSSNLDISLPSSMVGQIVSNRLGAAVNPDSPLFSIGEPSFFNSETDLFISLRPIEETEEDSVGPESETSTAAEKEAELDSKYDFKRRGSDTDVYDRVTGEKIGNVVSNEAGLKIRGDSSTSAALNDAVNQYNDVQTTKKQEKESASSNLQAYLNKIDVVPKSSLTTISNASALEILSYFGLKSDKFFQESFAIFCLDDSDFFDLLKQYFLRDKYKKTNGKSLSTLIPIKYTFTILGNSGIRRGDVFKIKGIPKKYSERGIFQITEIEHTLEGSKWTTQIGGLFRQVQ